VTFEEIRRAEVVVAHGAARDEQPKKFTAWNQRSRIRATTCDGVVAGVEAVARFFQNILSEPNIR
jgi:hypothetical protein